MTIDITQYQGWIAILIGVVLPAAVALVTKEMASSKYKNTALLVLSGIASVLVPLSGAASLDVKAVVTNFLTIFGTAVVSYVGIYKPRGTTAAIQSAVPGGLGSVEELPVGELDESDLEPVDDTAVDLPDEGGVE
jgi:uncharacterized membrane protein